MKKPKILVFISGIIFILIFLLASCGVKSVKIIEAPKEDKTTYTYTGNPITYNIKKSDDYTISNTTEINAGTYEIIISLKDKENHAWSTTRRSDDLKYQFKIEKMKVKKPNKGNNNFTYNGDNQTYNVSSSDLYTIANNVGKDANKYSATISLRDKANYCWEDSTSDDLSYEYTINPLSLDNATVTLEKEAYSYTGKPIEPVVTNVTINNLTLTKDDYDISYANNINTGTGKVIITGKGNYKQIVIKTFNIVNSKIEKPKPNTSTFTYNGSEQIYTLKENNLYTITNNKQKNAGSYKVRVSLNDKNNYCWDDSTTNDLEYDFIIEAKDINSCTLSILDETYTSKEITPLITNFDINNYDITYENNINVGVAKAIITGKNNYRGTKIITFNILPLSITNLNYITNDTTYSGNAITPSIIIKHNDKALLLNTDYILEHEEIINAGSYNLNIKGIGNYKDEVLKTINVLRLDISNKAIINDIESITYTSKEIKPTPHITYGNLILILNKDYTLTYKDNINAGTASIIVSFTGNFKGNKSKEFTISRLNIENAIITLSDPEFKFTGAEIKPVPTSITVNDINIDDYDISYENNIEISNNAKIIITGKGNFTGTITKQFIITSENIDISQADATYDNEYTYTGFEIKPEVTLKINNVVIESSNKYTISYENNINAGTAKIIITGIKNYTGTLELEFTINKAKIDIPPANNKEFIYNGVEQNYFDTLNDLLNYENNTKVAVGNYIVTVSIKDTSNYCWQNNESDSINYDFIIKPIPLNNIDFIFELENRTYSGLEITTTITKAKYKETDLVLDTDYEIASYENNINAGTAILNISGLGIYTGTLGLEFEILPLDITSSLEILDIAQKEYTSQEITPSITVLYNSNELDSSNYDISYKDNINAGTATVTIALKNNYTGSLSKEFIITPKSLSNLNIQYELEYTFIGHEILPTINSITVDNIDLILSTDYSISAINNINVGTATATITGINNYTSTYEFNFTINKLNINSELITYEIPSVTYTGVAITNQNLNISIKLGDVDVINQQDYSIETISDNVNAGTANIFITAKGNFEGQRTLTFTITKANIENVIAQPIPEQAYSGKAITPQVSLSFNNHSLTSSDYSLEYQNNIEIGTATIIITGNNNFTGTKNVEFEITNNIQNYNVHFNTNGGTAFSDMTYTSEDNLVDITLPTPTKVGYSFIHWVDSNENVFTNIPLGTNSNLELFAVYEIINYSITYHLDGGTNDQNNPEQYTILDNVIFANPTKNGYSFEGWFTNDSFDSENQIEQIPSGSTIAYEIYAKWSIITYTITFDSNGGSSVSNMTYTVETDTFDLPLSTKDGYQMNWFNNNNAVSRIEKGKYYENLNLVAHWIMIQYDITYELNGGVQNSNNPTTYNIESNITLLNPTKEGYDFNGWYKESTFDTEITTIDTSLLTNITIYAKWSIINYTITYELDGGTLTTLNPTSFNVDTEPFMLNNPTKAGYDFIGWTSNDSAMKQISLIVSTTIIGDKEFTANWQIHEYQITYELHDGLNNHENPSSFTILTNEFELKLPTKEGYTFKCWKLGVDVITSFNPTSSLNDVTFEAIFNECPYLIKNIDSNDGSINVLYNSSLVTLINYDENNKTLASSYNNQELTISVNSINTNKIYLGIYSNNVDGNNEQLLTTNYTYNLTVNVDSSKTVIYPKWMDYNITIEQIHINDLEYESTDIYYTLTGTNTIGSTITYEATIPNGLVFVGWFDSNDQSISSTTALEVVLQETPQTYKLKYYELTSLVKYHADGVGISYIQVSSNLVYGGNITLTATAVDNYIFTGWYNDDEYSLLASSDSIYTFEIPTYSSETVKQLYAKYVNDNITINKYYIDNTYTLRQTTASFGGTVLTKETGTTETIITFTSFTGFELTKFEIDNSTSYTIVNNTVTIPNPNELTIYNAIWEPINYTITYELDGGTNHVDNFDTFNIFTGTYTFKNPTKEGCNFLGWKYENEDITSLNLSNIHSNITLTANWIIAEVTVTYYPNNGDVFYSNELKPGDPLDTPTRDGYTFGGWYNDWTLSGDEITSVPTTNIELFAYWNEETKTSNFTFDGVIINGYNGTPSGTIIFPEYINNNKVTDIDLNYNWGTDYILPNGINHIIYGTYNGIAMDWTVLSKKNENEYTLLANQIVASSTYDESSDILADIKEALNATSAALPNVLQIKNNASCDCSLENIDSYHIPKSKDNYNYYSIDGIKYTDGSDIDIRGIRPVITITFGQASN